MRKAIVRLLEKTNNIPRSIYIWNAVNAIVLAMQTPVVMAVANRTNGEAVAGVFSIAMAEANLMYFVGQFGLRRYQSSDINEDFKFREYHAMRIITCIAMTAGCLAYCVFGRMNRGYDADKFLIILIICLIKVLMAYADVFHGHLHQRGRLDVAAKAATVRYVIELAIYIGGLIVTRDLLMTVTVCLAVSVVVFFLTSFNATVGYCDTMVPYIGAKTFRRMFTEGFPLFMGLFLNMYIGNAPKYAIDAYLTDDVQAVYNMIFMPTFVIQLVTQFIFNPVLTLYAELWLAHSRDKFRRFIRMIKKMCLTVFALAVLAVVLAATIGIPVLSVLFGTDLSDYRLEFCIIMAAGGFMGYSIYFNMLIAVIRAQKPLIYCYGIVSIMAKLMSGFFVRNYGITGAAALYAALMTLLTAALVVITVIPLRKEWDVINSEAGGASGQDAGAEKLSKIK